MSRRSKSSGLSRAPLSLKAETVVAPTALATRWLDRGELIFAFALSALMIAFHIYRATQAGPLWRDETATVEVASLSSFSQAWALLHVDSFPLLIYVLIRGLISVPVLGGSDFSLRVFGALVGIGIILVLWLSKRLQGYRAPLISLVLIALNASVFLWGDTIRGYGLGLLLIAATYGAVWKVVEAPTRWRVIAAVAISILSVQCMYQNALLLLAICAGGVCVCARRHWWKRAVAVAGTGAIAALSLLPYLSVIQSGKELRSIDQSDLFSCGRVFAMYGETLSSGSIAVYALWLTCFGIGILSAVLTMLAPQKGSETERSKDLATYGLTVLVAGTAAFFLFVIAARLTGFIFQQWYYISILGLSALALGTTIDVATKNVWRRVVRLALCIAMAALTIPRIGEEAGIRQSNIENIAQILEARASHDDLIVVNPYYAGWTFQRYYHGKTPWETVPPLENHGIYSMALFKRQMTAHEPLAPLFAQIERTLASGRHVWLVGTVPLPSGGPPPAPPTANGANGSFEMYYQEGWERQVGYFLATHVLSGQVVDPQTSQPVYPLENARLLMFDGWRPQAGGRESFEQKR